ncbi:hypothetical protein NECAME_07044 [Necator americanus]|uniref:Uncharacterized protein n=1 Tax=Necator americanus TaxID=51031 RepID=W2TSS0_NECAM|nr:hypothetical protein NECAME_07044 [Necator americanus]ETN84097.1 hypothetical protein NECAME_07044 [Necator americanus]
MGILSHDKLGKPFSLFVLLDSVDPDVKFLERFSGANLGVKITSNALVEGVHILIYLTYVLDNSRFSQTHDGEEFWTSCCSFISCRILRRDVWSCLLSDKVCCSCCYGMLANGIERSWSRRNRMFNCKTLNLLDTSRKGKEKRYHELYLFRVHYY